MVTGPGETLGGRYFIEAEIGRGAMATVFRATDLRQGRAVAVKILDDEVASAVGTPRFLQEIEFAKTLSHPNLLPVFDSDSEDGLLYYVSPLVKDETLRAKLDREGPCSIEETLRIAREIGDALDYLHREGIVHRDVKPSNVLMMAGHAVLADLGVAQAVSEAGGERLTSKGVAVGTPLYMSPEQCAAERQVDGRSDLYSLACVVYEMLAGTPPFAGGDARVVMARHLHEDPPSLRIARPSVGPALEAVIQRSLAKVAADRFPSAAEFLEAASAAALEAPGVAPSPLRRWWQARGRAIRAGSVTGVVAAGAIVAWALIGSTPALDSNRIVVFPLRDDRPRIESQREGEQVALLIGSTLEHTDPLKWIYGWSWLPDELREDPGRVTTDRAASIARDQGARYYVTGSILQARDSLTVIVDLGDASRRRASSRRSESGALEASAARLGLRALVQLLPGIVELDTPVDLSPFGDVAPAAIANWLQGEREYRRSRFGPALDFLERAVEADSQMSVAALRGALAASWEQQLDRARRLSAIALQAPGRLSERGRWFASAFNDYLGGRADSAIVNLRRALGADPGYADAWMLAGEVQYHLLPRLALDSLALRSIPPPHIWDHELLARQAFRQARRFDPGLTSPLFHLIEIAIRRGELPVADSLLTELGALETESPSFDRLRLELECVRDGPEVLKHASSASQAEMFSTIGASLAASRHEDGVNCSKTAFISVLNSDAATTGVEWLAVLGLYSVLHARGESASARAVLDSAVAGGLGAAMGLYVLDDIVTGRVSEETASFLARLGTDYPARFTATLWLLTQWAASRGDTIALASIGSALDDRARRSGERLDLLVRDIARANELLVRGDSAGALAAFEALQPNATHEVLPWSLWEPLAFERLTLVELYVAAGRFEDAHRTGAVFDHPAPIMHRFFEPQGLALRARAAAALGDAALESTHQGRLSRFRDSR